MSVPVAVLQAAQVKQNTVIALQDKLAVTGTKSVTLPPAVPAPPALVPMAVAQAAQVKQNSAAAL